MNRATVAQLDDGIAGQPIHCRPTPRVQKTEGR